MKVHRSRSVRRVEVTTDGRNLVSHAGTALLCEFADRTGLTRCGVQAQDSDATQHQDRADRLWMPGSKQASVFSDPLGTRRERLRRHASRDCGNCTEQQAPR